MESLRILKSWGRFLLPYACITLISGCASKLQYQTRQAVPPGKLSQEKVPLMGSYQAVDGAIHQLSEFAQKTTVVFFTSTICSSCIAETKELIQEVAGIAPEKVNLVTLLMYSDLDEVRSWQEELHVPWSVGVFDDVDYVFSLCPSKQIPCIVVQRADEGVVYSYTGKLTRKEIEIHSGPWSGASIEN